MSATTRQAHSVGEQLQSSSRLQEAIDAIVAEAAAHSARITDVRPPEAGAGAGYQELMDRAAATRGRGLLYPYIGSGLGNGALVELADGSVKWDMICGIGVHFFGHSEPDLIRASLEASLSDTVKDGNLQSGFEGYAFAEKLLQCAGRSSRLRHCYLSTSGAMANENALKVCYQKKAPASRVIAFADCFMGRSTTMAQIGDSAAGRVGVPLTTQVDYMPFWNEVAARRIGQGRYIQMAVEHLEMLLRRYPQQYACFIFELVQGEGGFNTAPREFFVALMDVCRAHGVPIWDDEIQTFGRLERMFAYEALELGDYVDVFCVGKMTQACATLFTEEFNPKPGLLSGTFIGESVSFRVGRRILEKLDEGDYYGPDGSIARHHRLFREQVEALAARHPEWFGRTEQVPEIVGGRGGMMRFTPFGGAKDKIVKACSTLFDAGVVAFYCGHDPYHLRFLPPLGVLEESDWPRIFACVERGLAAVD
ncbi:MAG: aminotransferase class III-fold pyridoxal phosphate-dependent enzyme [Phycisphaerales bacterium JB039]